MEVITTVISLINLPELELVVLYLEIFWLLGGVLKVQKLAKPETYLSRNQFYETTKLYNSDYLKSILSSLILPKYSFLFKKSYFYLSNSPYSIPSLFYLIFLFQKLLRLNT